MLTQYAVGHILYLRTGNGGEQNPRVEVATEPGTGSKPLLSSEAQKTRQTLREAEPVSRPRPNSTRRLEQDNRHGKPGHKKGCSKNHGVTRRSL